MGEMLIDWEGHDKALSNKLLEFLKEDFLVDFNVTCHGQQKKVHKFVLAFLFPMLKESLRSPTTFCLEQEVERNAKVGTQIPPQCLNLDNIANHPEDMDYLIQFAYTGKTTVPNNHAKCLMHIADSMEIESLKKSLGQWHNKIKAADKNESNDAAPLRRLRPRTQLKKVLSESNDIVISDDDLDFHSVVVDNRTKELRKIDSSRKANNATSSKKGKRMSRSAETGKKKNRNLKCNQCDYVAKYPCNLQRHLESHARKDTEDRKPFICKINKNDLEKHCDMNSGKESYVCKYCGHKTLRKLILIQHMKVKHQVDSEGKPLEKNIKCPDCNFVCYAKHQLMYHTRAKHERIGKFKCKECNFSAPYISQLQRHDRVMHQNIRNHMCEECGHRFTTSGRLKDHILVRHKGVKLFKCEVCEKEYSDSLSFKIHMQSHEGKVVYKFVCHICGHNLRRKYELRDHMRKKHGMEMDGYLAMSDNPINPDPGRQSKAVSQSTS